jgi:hypothetical protein
MRQFEGDARSGSQRDRQALSSGAVPESGNVSSVRVGRRMNDVAARFLVALEADEPALRGFLE